MLSQSPFKCHAGSKGEKLQPQTIVQSGSKECYACLIHGSNKIPSIREEFVGNKWTHLNTAILKSRAKQ